MQRRKRGGSLSSYTSADKRSLFKKSQTATRRPFDPAVDADHGYDEELNYDEEEDVHSEDLTDENTAEQLRDREVVEDGRKALKESRMFPLDCGRYGQPRHLSLAHAMAVGEDLSPGYINDFGVKMPHRLDAHLGWYRWPCQSEDSKSLDSELDDYGIGIVFYFKLLKALLVLFFIMTLLTLPGLVLFTLGNTKQSVQRKYTEAYDTQKILAYTTLGALGEPIPTCRQVPENRTFAFECPANGVINSIIAYYGQPQGSCTCPGLQQTDVHSKCNGTRSGSSKGSSLLVSQQFSYKDQYCVLNAQGVLAPCFLGYTRYGVECCSLGLDASYHPDLSNLDLQPSFTCNSYTAPYISQALCLGKSSCSFVVDINSTVSFPMTRISSNVSSAVCIGGLSTPDTCVTSLGTGGIFSGCDAGATNSLIFEAICVASVTVLSGNTTDLSMLSDTQTISHADIIGLASVLNAVSILVFLIGVCVIRGRQQKEARVFEKRSCRAADYTVEVRTVPHSISTLDLNNKIRDHFETILAEEPAINLNHPDACAIADINFGTSCYEYIQAACERGRLAREVDRTVAKLLSRLRQRLFTWESWTDVSLLNRLKRVLYSFEEVNARCISLQYRAAGSIDRIYVTFETEEGYLRCLRAYSSSGILRRCLQSPELYFENHSEPIVLCEAPDPSEIKWENIGVPWWTQILRVIATSLLTIGLLAVSYVMIYEALTVAEEASGSKAYKIACDTYKVTLNTDPLFMSSVDGNTITYRDVQYDYNWDFYNKSSYGSNGYLLCFCQQLNFDLGSDSMKTFKFLNERTSKEEPWCAAVATKSFSATVASYVATLVVIAVNTCLYYLLDYLAAFECHSSDTIEVISLSLKLFVAQYINTGLLSLIIYGDLTGIGVLNVLLGTAGGLNFGFFTGTFSDFSAAWYTSVGSSLLFTMCLFVLGSQSWTSLAILWKFLLMQWDKRTGSCFPFTSQSITHSDLQSELDALYIKVEFPFEVQISSLLTIVFVTMTYSPAMPLMNVIACVSIFALFLFNKLFLLRFHCTPPAYSAVLPTIMTGLLYGAALIHCAVGIWMFSNNNFYSPDFADKTELHPISAFNVTHSFLTATHSWTTQVSLNERITSTYSLLLLGIFIALSLFIAWKIAYLILYYIFGVNYLDLLFFLDSQSITKVFRDRAANNPPYFKSLPVSLLDFRIESGVFAGRLLNKYRERLDLLLSRSYSNTHSKLMEGLESYNIAASSEYTYKFGLDSSYMRRAPPPDWLVSRTGAADIMYLNSAAMGRRHSVRSSFTALLRNSVSEKTVFYDEEFDGQIAAILEYCSPVRTADGAIRRRSTNILHRSGFINNRQAGRPVFSATQRNSFDEHTEREDPVELLWNRGTTGL